MISEHLEPGCFIYGKVGNFMTLRQYQFLHMLRNDNKTVPSFRNELHFFDISPNPEDDDLLLGQTNGELVNGNGVVHMCFRIGDFFFVLCANRFHQYLLKLFTMLSDFYLG